MRHTLPVNNNGIDRDIICIKEVWLMAFISYLLHYRFSHIAELLRNEKKSPLECPCSIAEKTVVLSGATSGIGLETARFFAAKGADLICLNRDPVKSDELEKELKEKFNCRIRTIIVDFSSLKQLHHCADQLLSLDKTIDVLIHNAGVFNTKMQLSEDDIEMVFHVNHLASFLLNYRLKEKLKKENTARIIYVNSEGHRFALGGIHLNDLKWKRHIYSGLKSYGAAKTAQLLTMMKFDDYFSDSAVTINAMHPGNVKSNMGENNGALYRFIKRKLVLSSAKDPFLSAQSLYYLAGSEELRDVSGKFFNLTSEETPAPHARDIRKINAVWNKSLELCRLM